MDYFVRTLFYFFFIGVGGGVTVGVLIRLICWVLNTFDIFSRLRG